MRLADFALGHLLVASLAACAVGGDEADFGGHNPGDGDGDGDGGTGGDGDGDGDGSGDGDGDGDGAGDGDGDGDGGGDGDGDGDGGGDGDGDGDGDGECGNDTIDGDEECDGNEFGAVGCDDYGFNGGVLLCDACEIVTDLCYQCGDGVKSDLEICDGADFGGETCQTLGFASGTLSCSADCDEIDDSDCVPEDDCGNGQIDAGEDCDGANMNGHTCVSEGFDQGNISCTAGCGLDTSGCSYAGCLDLLDECSMFNDQCCPGLVCVLTTCLPE